MAHKIAISATPDGQISLSTSDSKGKFYQWDADRYLIAKGLPDGCEIHFASKKLPEPIALSLHELDGNLICDIPDELLQDTESFTVYAYLTDEHGSRTVYTRTFTVDGRPKPPGYVYTPEERKTWEALEERMSRLEKNGGTLNGVPPGGKAGQILYKKSDVDYDLEWRDLTVPEEYGLISYDQDKTITIT